MTGKPSPTIVRAWARLMRAQNLALAAAEGALKAAGLPALAWYDVLLETERAGAPGARPLELQRALLLAQYNLSRLLDRLEREGLIERKPFPGDGRGQVIRITDAGRTVRRKMWPVYARAIEAAIGDNLEPKEIEALDGLLGRLIVGLGQMRRRAWKAC